jgi:short-subunit dehydrogenase
MSERRSGHILNVVSTVARTSLENYSAYTAMKYALHGFTQCLIKEARRVNVKVTGVYPGGTDTDFRPETRPDYMRPESAAQMIVQCIQAPGDVVVHELVYRPIIETNF